MRQRKNVVNMTDGEVAAFRGAVQSLQNLPDPQRNYSHFAEIHVKSCVHNCELFLPWHRAFILDYENALRGFSANLTLPFWDWIAEPAIPEIFTAPPLLHDRDPNASGQRLPTADEIRQALLIHDFFLFGGTRCIPGIPSVPGQLDNLHGYVHLWVGGDMGDVNTFKSAFDPIFWSHHSNVDRLWAVWQSTFGIDGPLDTTVPLRGLDTRRTTADVLDIGPNGLGYEYVEAAFDLPIRGRAMRHKERFTLVVDGVRSKFTRAEVRLVELHPVNGSAMPSAIDVVMPGMRVPPRVSLFGLHKMHGEMAGHGSTMKGPSSISPRLDVTDSILDAVVRHREVQIEIRLIAQPGMAEDACRIGVQQLQLVLLA
jgi:tyrosinase